MILEPPLRVGKLEVTAIFEETKILRAVFHSQTIIPTIEEMAAAVSRAQHYLVAEAFVSDKVDFKTQVWDNKITVI